jgi:acyl transferase domain-containing protein
VFCGTRVSEYLTFNLPIADIIGVTEGSPVAGLARLIANGQDYAATRIAFKLDLQGPAINVHTACSTSLVALHLACKSLLDGECDLALAGGATVRVPHRAGYLHSEGMTFSRDGHTRGFDADASGTLFSSGVGLVLLKRLDRALADRDDVWAVVRGTAVNNDGAVAKAAFSAPSQVGQARVIREALAAARVSADTISYLEAHGTGTGLGDPIEVAGLTDAFRDHTDRRGYCAIGSLKSNVGHMVQASGVGGVVKVALMMRHRELVPHLHYRRANPLIDFEASPFRVVTERRPWSVPDGQPRRAGVSSFGIGGTNAHVVLEEPPPRRRYHSLGRSSGRRTSWRSRRAARPRCAGWSSGSPSASMAAPPSPTSATAPTPGARLRPPAGRGRRLAGAHARRPARRRPDARARRAAAGRLRLPRAGGATRRHGARPLPGVAGRPRRARSMRRAPAPRARRLAARGHVRRRRPARRHPLRPAGAARGRAGPARAVAELGRASGGGARPQRR